MSTPTFACLRTTPATSARRVFSYAGSSHGCPWSRADRMSRIDIGRTRLPTCVTRMRSVLRFIVSSPSLMSSYVRALIRLRQAENFFRNEIQDHVRGDRRDSRDHHLAQIALDMKLLRIAHAAVSHDRGLAGVERRFACEIF